MKEGRQGIPPYPQASSPAEREMWRGKRNRALAQARGEDDVPRIVMPEPPKAPKPPEASFNDGSDGGFDFSVPGPENAADTDTEESEGPAIIRIPPDRR